MIYRKSNAHGGREGPRLELALVKLYQQWRFTHTAVTNQDRLKTQKYNSQLHATYT